MTYHITAVVCTYGDAPQLSRALASLAEQRLSNGASFDILCVDNNVEPRVTLPASLAACVRLIHEPAPGLVRARNAAIAHTEATVIAFLDDDAAASPDWANELLKAFDATGAWCLGGRVLPEWPGEPPAWLDPRLHYLLGLLDLGDKAQILKGPVFPCGANLAVRRSAFERVGAFRTGLGRRPGSLLSGEETDLCWRVMRAGGTVVYTPNAVVHHIIAPSRLTSAYLRNRALWEGFSLALVDRLNRGMPYALGAALARTALAAVREPLTAIEGLAAGSGAEVAICRLCKVWGYWAGLFARLSSYR